MICALMLDADDAVEFAGNKGVALGRPLAAYPLIAAKSSRLIARIYVVTDSPPVKAAALQYGAIIIDPPAGRDSHHDSFELLLHGYRFVREELKEEQQALELLGVLSAQAPAIDPELIDQGLEALQSRPELDSAITVSNYNRFHPLLAARQTPEGLIEPYLPGRNNGIQPPATLGHAGQTPEEVWYFDGGLQLLRPRLLESDSPWGRKVLPLKQWGASPIDYAWQIPSLEFWLKKHGSSDVSASLEPKPQPQLAPKTGRP
ncbi:MAG: hypothetical protein HY549_01925 [Elusimicrobia bacterium]|nr:hypothetical protein [Elusimicrobiota bacterium]